jgi:hypothetical protein
MARPARRDRTFPLLTTSPRLISAARLAVRGAKLARNSGNISDFSRLQVEEYGSAIPMDVAFGWKINGPLRRVRLRPEAISLR